MVDLLRVNFPACSAEELVKMAKGRIDRWNHFFPL